MKIEICDLCNERIVDRGDYKVKIWEDDGYYNKHWLKLDVCCWCAQEIIKKSKEKRKESEK